jgi:RNA polymerase sigma-70 factor, ECF subfamily
MHRAALPTDVTPVLPAAMPGLEQSVLALRAEGDLDGAATELVRGYGAEILGFLESTLGDDAMASDAFSLFSEDVWRGLAGFQGASTLRTWAYAVARRTAFRVLRGELTRRERFVADDDAAHRAAAQVRTTTARFRRTAVKDEVRALRDQLSPDERELLLLRIDRGLDWREIARIQLEDESSLEDVAQRAGLLRKRFERAKARLRELAVEAGILAR